MFSSLQSHKYICLFCFKSVVNFPCRSSDHLELIFVHAEVGVQIYFIFFNHMDSPLCSISLLNLFLVYFMTFNFSFLSSQDSIVFTIFIS